MPWQHHVANEEGGGESFGKCVDINLFIRAPYIEKIGVGVQVLAEVDGRIVAARYGKQLALAFHPELDTSESTAVHEYFLRMCDAN